MLATAAALGLVPTVWAGVLLERDVEPDGWAVPNAGSIAAGQMGLEPKAGDNLYLLQGRQNWVNGGVTATDFAHAIEPGTYTITFDVGLAEGTKFPGTDGQRLAVGFFDPAASPEKNGLRDAINAFLETPGVTAGYVQNDVPEAGGWQEWVLTITVAPDSAAIGREMNFGVAVNTGKDDESRSLILDRVKLEHEPAAQE